MTKLSFQNFITQVGLAQAEKMNTCHDELGQFCSTGGAGGASSGGTHADIAKTINDKLGGEKVNTYDSAVDKVASLYDFPSSKKQDIHKTLLSMGFEEFGGRIKGTYGNKDDTLRADLNTRKGITRLVIRNRDTAYGGPDISKIP